jgi:lipopolysaccharide/colanic/teichoic acid biosynthesis glycosyltransferase
MAVFPTTETSRALRSRTRSTVLDRGPAPPARPLPVRKRIFDLAIVALTSPVWMPASLACAAAILIGDGRPVLYLSHRRIGGGTARVAKFRTMRIGAAEVANRDTIPVERVRFLNIPTDSPLYSGVGRRIEHLAMTELPQLWLVVRGAMSVVGNRPLPDNVVTSLKEAHPDVEHRFRVPCGLTGPVQLVGRDHLSDRERLDLEAAYVDAVAEGYRVRLDVSILLRTAIVAVRPGRRMSATAAHALISRHRRPGGTG